MTRLLFIRRYGGGLRRTSVPLSLKKEDLALAVSGRGYSALATTTPTIHHALDRISWTTNDKPVLQSPCHHHRVATDVYQYCNSNNTSRWLDHNSYNNLYGGHHGRLFSTAAMSNNDDNDDEKNIIPFRLADIGEGIKEVELLQWFVQQGDHVQQFDRICEVQSDKATVEITSRYDGIVESLAGGEVGDFVQVGDPLLLIRVAKGEESSHTASASREDSAAATSEDPSSSSSPSEPYLHSQDSSSNHLRIPHVASHFHLDSDDDIKMSSSNNATPRGENILATPAVRKLGMEYNLDLSTLVGSGPQGRVLKSDVLTFLRESGQWRDRDNFPQQQKPTSERVVAQATPTKSHDNEEADPLVSTSSTDYLHEDEVVTLKGYNRFMIQTMTASQEIPHMGYTDEFNLTKLIQYRRDLVQNVSILAFFVKATSLALKEYPIVNASWKDIEKGQVTMWASHNVGVAMDTPRGLVVPMIKNCEDKSLAEIQQDLNKLKEIAAQGKFTEEHLVGATISISNIGSLGGGTYMNPLIVPPQAAIGAMGAIQTLPRFDATGNVTAAKLMPISWAGDHRMFDGATLARFSNRCKEYLEDPVKMLLAMK